MQSKIHAHVKADNPSPDLDPGRSLAIREFLRKFPDTSPAPAVYGGSFLKDMACPRCGWREKFLIQARATAVVTDDEAEASDAQWESDSPCECGCPTCTFQGTVKDFTIAGLDEYLEEAAQKRDFKP